MGLQIDITSESGLKQSVDQVAKPGRLDILIHCAGLIHQGLMQDAKVQDLDLQYTTNVRGPGSLNKCMQPMLEVSYGQIVFVNSSADLTAK